MIFGDGNYRPNALESELSHAHRELSRTQAYELLTLLRGSRFLPAGVPRGLLRLKERIVAFFAAAPIVFIGVVLGVALLFKVGVDAVKPASAEPEASATARNAKQQARGSALGESAGSTTSTSTTSVSTPSTAVITATGPAEHRPTTGGPAPAPPRRKPKNHGKR